MARMIRVTAAALGAVAALTLSACSDDEPQRDEEGNVTESADAADVFEIQVGDCVGDFGDAEEVTNLPIGPCEEEHDQEVYAISQIDDGEFPGAEAFRKRAEKDCVAEFKTFIGVAWKESELDFTWLEPTAESWEQGDRELVCLAYDPAGPVTGTLKGAKR